MRIEFSAAAGPISHTYIRTPTRVTHAYTRWLFVAAGEARHRYRHCLRAISLAEPLVLDISRPDRYCVTFLSAIYKRLGGRLSKSLECACTPSPATPSLPSLHSAQHPCSSLFFALFLSSLYLSFSLSFYIPAFFTLSTPSYRRRRRRCRRPYSFSSPYRLSSLSRLSRTCG